MAFGAKIGISVDTSKSAQFKKEIRTFVNDSVKDIPIKITHLEASITKSEASKMVKELQSSLDQTGGMSLKINKIDASPAIEDLRTQLQNMLSGLHIEGLKDFMGDDQYKPMSDSIKKAKAEALSFNSQLESIRAINSKLDSVFKSGLSGKDAIGDQSQLKSFTESYSAYQEKMAKFKADKVALDSKEFQALQQEAIALQRLIALKQQEQATVNSASSSKRKDRDSEIISLKEKESLYRKIAAYEKANPKAMRDQFFGSHISRLRGSVIGNNSMTRKEADIIKNDFSDIIMRASMAKKSGKSLGDVAIGAYERFGGWMTVTKSLTTLIRGFKQMVSTVIELDTAMIELKKVTDLADVSYDRFLTKSISRAKGLGSTVSEVINATADFARLGYNIDEASDLADAAIIYKNVGDGIEDVGAASESIISTMKAFNVESQNAMAIVDKFNEVGNKFAISSKGVGDALQRSAAALAAAGNTLDESIGMAVGMNSVLQNPEKVGTVLQTASMFLRAAKTEAEDVGESTDGMANSASKLRDTIRAITDGSVDIMKNKDTFKSTIQIYRELAGVWDDLADVDRASLLELMGGKRNATANASILTNFGDVEKALTVSSGASGSALVENEKYLESIEGRITKLKASFQKLSTDAISGDFIKGSVEVLDFLVKVLNFGDLLIPKIALISTGIWGIHKAYVAIKGLKIVGRDKKTSLIIVCPPYSDGNIERACIKNGDISKTVSRQQLKWCA